MVKLKVAVVILQYTLTGRMVKGISCMAAIFTWGLKNFRQIFIAHFHHLLVTETRHKKTPKKQNTRFWIVLFFFFVVLAVFGRCLAKRAADSASGPPKTHILEDFLPVLVDFFVHFFPPTNAPLAAKNSPGALFCSAYCACGRKQNIFFPRVN